MWEYLSSSDENLFHFSQVQMRIRKLAVDEMIIIIVPTIQKAQSSNLLIFISNGMEELSDSEDWNKIILHIEKMSKAKKSKYKSLTTKTIFKYMDLLEQLED